MIGGILLLLVLDFLKVRRALGLSELDFLFWVHVCLDFYFRERGETNGYIVWLVERNVLIIHYIHRIDCFFKEYESW